MAKVSSGQRVLAELSADPVALRNKHTTITGQIDALERRLDYLEGRLENAQKTGNQTVYNAVLKQYQEMANRVQSLATEANSIGESIQYGESQRNRQQKITDSKPKTTMDKVRESLPYALGSGIRDMIVDTGKGLGQTALYAENAIRGSTLGKNDKGFTTLQLGKAGTQGSVMNPEDITMGDVAGEYATALGENTGFYGDVLNSMMHWRQGRLKPDSEDEKYAKMFGGVMRDAVGTKPLEDDTVLKGARMVADPFAVLGGGTAVLKTGANAIDNFGDIAKGFRRGDGRYIPRDQLGAIDVWHASPHEFDEFKPNANIGRGEGAQAYGAGGYTAKNKKVANHYFETLRKDVSDMDWRDAQGNKITPKANQFTWQLLDLADGDIDKAKIMLQGWMRKYPDTSALNQTLADLNNYEQIGLHPTSPRQNHLYKIRLAWDDAQKEKTMPLKDEHFLDLDEYMERQSPYVQEKLAEGGYKLLPNDKEIQAIAQQRIEADAYAWADETGGDPTDFMNENWGKYMSAVEKEIGGIDRRMTGKEFYKLLREENGYQPSLFEGKAEYDRMASDQLYDMGIVGNRYLDGNSRNAGSGDYNYVNFSDDLATVLKRNGVPIKKVKK